MAWYNEIDPTGILRNPIGRAIVTIALVSTGNPYAIAVAIALNTAGAISDAEHAKKAAREAEEAAKAAYNNSLQDRTITKVGTDSPYVTAYGLTCVGCSVVAIFTSGDKDEYKWLVCVHAAHPCESIEDILVNDKSLGTIDPDTGDAGTDSYYYKVTTSSITETHTGTTFTLSYTPLSANTLVVGAAGRGGAKTPFTLVGKTVTLGYPVLGNLYATYTYHDSTAYVKAFKHISGSDPVDQNLQDAVGSLLWPDTAVLSGFTYTVIRLNLNMSDFQGGIPSIKAVLHGKKLYDFRNSTWVGYPYSSNPALVIYDYLTSDACGVDASELPIADYTAVANLCDSSLYTINGTVTADQEPPTVLDKMVQAIAGTLVATTWSLKAGVWEEPIALTLDQSDIVGALSITAGQSDADVYNGVKGQYTGAATLYVVTDFPSYQNSTYRAVDGRDMWTNIDFPFTDNVQGITNLCRIYTEDLRNSFTLSATFSLKVWDIEIGDRVNFTSSFLGESSKVFRITDKKYNPEGTISLVMKEDAAAIWDLADAVVADETPNTNLADPFIIESLGYITCTSGLDAVLVQTDSTLYTTVLVEWPASTSQSILDHGVIEIYWRDVEDDPDAWKNKVVAGDSTYTYISPLADGHSYLVRARCVDRYLNIASDWAYIDGDPTHTVEALLVAPATPTNFYGSIIVDGILLTWDADTDQIYNYEIRQGGSAWGVGDTFLANVKSSQLKLPPYTLASRYVDESVIYRIKAINTLGKYSDVEATFLLLIKYPRVVTDVSTKIVDNYVLLYWQPPTVINQDIETYEIRKGNEYSTSELIGLKSGQFTTVFESTSGTYLYWITAVDVGGNYGQQYSIAATVSQPQDYVLHFNYNSDFTGTKVNAVTDEGILYLPFSDTTFQQHFTNHSWSTIQDQLTAGFPLYVQPAPAAGSYEDIWYLGSELNSSRITATINSVILGGAPSMQVIISTAPNIDTSPDVAGTWTAYAAGSSIFATIPFSWIKVHIDVFAEASPPSGLDVLEILEINVRLDEKGKTAAGQVTCGSSDTYDGHDGTPVSISGMFADVSSIQLTIASSGASPLAQAAYAIYDFVDVPNPDYFLVLLYNHAGTRVAGDVSWLVKGF